MKAKSICIPRNLRGVSVFLRLLVRTVPAVQGGLFWTVSLQLGGENVGAEAGDELEEGGQVSSGSGGSWFALHLYALARSQARSRRLLFMVVRISLFLHLFGCRENERA